MMVEKHRKEVLRRVWGRGWWSGFWLGLTLGLAVTSVGIAAAILAMSPHLSPDLYVVGPMGIALGGGCTAAVMSVAFTVGMLAERHQKK